MTKDLEKPMGNAEQRLRFQGLESEIAEIKSIGIDSKTLAENTHILASATNGKVKWQEKMIYAVYFGLLPCLVAYLGWLSLFTIHNDENVAKINSELQTQQQDEHQQIIQAAQQGVLQGLEDISNKK